MSIHEGHRKRLKERFRKEGLDSFEDLYVLELLLFYCVQQKDTNLIAHRLIERFGSLSGVLDANPRELETVKDVGPGISGYFSLLKAMWRRYEIQRADTACPLRTIQQCGEHIKPHFLNRSNETVFLLCLDAKCKAIACLMVGEGSVNSASISIRKIVEMALNTNATSVVLAHNHPSGLAIPSAEDIQTTKRLGRALAAVEIALADHLIFADGEFVSLVQSGKYSLDSCREILI